MEGGAATAFDVLRDAVTLYLEGRGDWSREEEWERARALGLADDDGPLTDDHRHGLRGKIAQGVAAAREGRLVEGEGVFARIEAELDALERLGGA